ncbi:MAG: MFS transporter [Pseudomonadota bacterium]
MQSFLNRFSFLGWRMVLVAFFIDFIAVGFFFYSYGVFFKAIAEEFGDSRLGVAIGITVTQVVGALLAPFIGRALDRYPLKRIMTFGATSMGLGFLFLSQVTTPLQFYLVLGAFIGVGSGAMGQLATSKLVSNWFVLKRGSALGIAATGISASGVVMPAISAWLIGMYGWREGFMFFGIFTLIIVVPVVLSFVISTPEEVGLLPDGEKESHRLPPPKPPLSTREFLGDSNFWFLVVAMGFIFSCMSATFIHMVPKVTDLGHDLVAASFIASVAAALGIVGKLVYGNLADRWDIRYALWLCIACQITGQLFMFSESYSVFLFGAAIFGFGAGGMVPMQGATVAYVFGRASFGRVMGAMRPAMAVIQLIGVPFAGWVFDTTGSYDPAFVVFIGFYVMAAFAVWWLKIPRRQALL